MQEYSLKPTKQLNLLEEEVMKQRPVPFKNSIHRQSCCFFMQEDFLFRRIMLIIDEDKRIYPKGKYRKA